MVAANGRTQKYFEPYFGFLKRSTPMKPRTILLILLALVCGVSAAVGVNQLNRSAAPAEDDTVPVVLASQDIPRGGVLTPENCKIRQWPKSLLSILTIKCLLRLNGEAERLNK